MFFNQKVKKIIPKGKMNFISKSVSNDILTKKCFLGNTNWVEFVLSFFIYSVKKKWEKIKVRMNFTANIYGCY